VQLPNWYWNGGRCEGCLAPSKFHPIDVYNTF